MAAGGSDRGNTGQDAARRERLAAALRDNLKRRKAQARARRENGPPGSGDPHACDAATGSDDPRPGAGDAPADADTVETNGGKHPA